MDSRAMLAVALLTVGSAAPTISKTKNNEKELEVSMEELNESSSSVVAELKDLKNQIELLILPALQSLYFKGNEGVKYLVSKKMVKMKKRLKNAKSYLLTMKAILAYLRKYQKHIDDLKNFNLETDIDVLDSTLSKRLFILEILKDKVRLVVEEISEYIALEEKEDNSIRSKKVRNIPLLRFKDHGDFSYMTFHDIYYLNHKMEFLDYSIEQLRQKRKQKQRTRLNQF